jgi:hypothetical protein
MVQPNLDAIWAEAGFEPGSSERALNVMSGCLYFNYLLLTIALPVDSYLLEISRNRVLGE